MVLHRCCCYVGDDAIEFTGWPVATDIPQTGFDFSAECKTDLFRWGIGGDVDCVAAISGEFAGIAAEGFLCRLGHALSPLEFGMVIVERRFAGFQAGQILQALLGMRQPRS